MKDLFDNYKKILVGIFGLLAFAPGFLVITAAVVLFVKYWWELIKYLWLL